MLEFGMPTLIENKTLEDNIALCKELGLSFIELNMNFPEYQIDKIEDIDWFYKKADEAGIYYTIHLDENLNVADFNPLTINMHMHHGIYITLPDKKVQMYERDFDVYMEYISYFVNACEEWIGESDIQIAIENTDGFREYEEKAIESMLERDCFVLTWDIGHSKGTGEIDLTDRLNMAKTCNARCVLETKTIEALKKSVE